MKIGINGMGRIGRGLFKALRNDSFLEVAAVNDVAEVSMIAHLLRHDSYYGGWEAKVENPGGVLRINGRDIPFFREDSPERIPWKSAGVEWVVEATGRFKDREALSGHGCPVVLTAASKLVDRQVVFGVNHETIKDGDRYLSATSCTAHCVAPPLVALDRAFGARSVLFNTVHCYNVSQTLVDAPRSDPRRARAGALNMIPTTTSASLAIEDVIPQLRGKVRGMAIRVPAPAVSLTEIIVETEHPPADALEANAILSSTAESSLKGILSICNEELVSQDFRGAPFSSIVDAPLTQVQGGLIRLIAWYDNERGYIMRLVDLLEYLRTMGMREQGESP